MSNQSPRIIHREALPLGGFDGIVETRMAMSPRLWPEARQRPDISHGLGDFVYLASGYFKPNDGARIHPHHDVDIVSVILNGRVGHQGSLGDGTVIEGPGVQVQRAGSGMQHAEFSLEDRKAEIVQIWFLPPERGLTPAYQNFSLKPGELTTVLGGESEETFHNRMVCRVGFVAAGETVRCEVPFVAMITEGTAEANGTRVQAGDLLEGEELTLSSSQETGLVLIHRQDH